MNNKLPTMSNVQLAIYGQQQTTIHEDQAGKNGK